MEVVTSLEQFEQLREDWSALTANPFRSFHWNFAWWKSFQNEGELRLFVLRAGDSIVGIAPLFEDQWLGQKRLRFIGSGKTCTDYTGFIVSEAWRGTFVAEFTAIVDDYCSILELEGVGDDEGNVEFEKSVSNSFWCEEEDIDSTWLLALPGSWDEFKAESKKSLRRKIKKAEKRLDSDSFEIRSTLEDDLCSDEAWNLLVQLHQGRFTSKGEEGAFADPCFDSFLKGAFDELSKEHRAEIIVAYCDGEPIGAHLYFFGEEGPQLYQAGIQIEKIACEPGHLLITHAVRKSIERGYQNLDFLRGTEKYKSYWGAVPKQLRRIRYVSKAMLPSSVVQGHMAFRKIRQAIKPLCGFGPLKA